MNARVKVFNKNFKCDREIFQMNKFGIEKRMAKHNLSRGGKLRMKFAAKRAQTFEPMESCRRSSAAPAGVTVGKLNRMNTMAPAKQQS